MAEVMTELGVGSPLKILLVNKIFTMDNKITSLQPQVWKYFNAICQVPRPSGHLDKITEYI